MTNFMEFYKNELQSARLNNINEAQALAQSILNKNFNDLTRAEQTALHKAENASNRVNGLYTAKDYLEEVCRSKVVATMLAKDPTKQNFAEKCQPIFIRNKTKFEVKNLANTALCIENGKFIKVKERKDKSSKSVDYIVEHRKTVDYVCAKVIQSGGGGQDLATIDGINYVKSAMEYVNKNSDKNRFVVLIDADDVDYISQIQKIIPKKYHKKIIVTTSDNYVKL